MAPEETKRTCVVVLHDDRVSREDVLCGANVLPFGCVARLAAPGSRSLCIVANKTASNPHEISLHSTLARRFGFENRIEATIYLSDDTSTVTATHVELLFRDQHLSRADMWRIKRAADGKIIYRDRSLEYLGSMVASVQAIYIKGQAVESALVSYQRTKLIFRSGSARYTFLIQISKEMLEYWRDGDLMYERMLLGYLPELFKRWDALKVRHQVSIVMFGRSDEADAGRDFFRVIATDISSALWRQLLDKLKRVFNDLRLPGQVSLAAKGNMLDAIHSAAMDFMQADVDLHLNSSGTSIIAITAGTGSFETSFERLKRTTLMLMGNSIGVDIVALSPKPLHPVPLFCYKQNDRWEYALPHWVDISFWHGNLLSLTSGWLLPESTGCIDDISLPSLCSTLAGHQTSDAFMDHYDNVSFGAPTKPYQRDTVATLTKREPPEGSTEAVKTDVKRVDDLNGSGSILRMTPGISRTERRPSNASSITRAKRDSLPQHSLMQTSRKISVGPRGLAPSRGVASTTVSVQHAQQGRDITASFTPNDSSSGLAKQIRQSLNRKESQQSLISHQTVEVDSASKPINIGTGLEVETDDPSDPATVMERKVMKTVPEDVLTFESQLSDTPKAKQSTFLDLARAAEADDKPTNSPWVTLFNPCNPKRENMRVASQYRKWQHVFPRAISSSAFKWVSMCSPAALPLTNEYRPSMRELETRATKRVRRILVPPADHFGGDAASQMMSRLIALRLMHGFQMSSSENSGPRLTLSQQNERILMSIGSLHHELHCLSAAEIQIVEYDAHAIEQEDSDTQDDVSSKYSTRITSTLGNTSKLDLPFAATRSALDWSSLDDGVVSHGEELSDMGRMKMRFVLIPVEPPRAAAHTHQSARELLDEEMRTDGIQKLTLLWQRHRYFTDEDHRRQATLVRPKASKSVLDRDPNPLAIEYQTRDPSAVVNAYGPLLTGQPYNGEQPGPLFAESEMYHSSTFDVAKLVKQMQEPPPHGVEVRDRRWFTRTHFRCFRGDEMVNWLLRVFKDLQSREDAVAVGNELMNRGIFSHVRHKHDFRDGNYFYQITSAHRTVDYPDTASMFGKGALKSVPSTPLMESRPSPMMRPILSDSDSFGKQTPKQTPVMTAFDRKQVLLSQVMQFNVDPTSKSEQLEIVNLHYDRIHNPENCYHIQLEWTNTTAKLIRDAVSRWTSLVDGYGLRLVQLPIAEASRLRAQHPFEVPMTVKLAQKPPNRIPATLQLDLQTLAPKMTEDSLAYQKAILRKMDFVLDYEAAASFTTKLDISYSFGRPDYELTQFVHKSGLVLAQISGDDRSDFLLLPNRLATHRSPVAGRAAESETPEGIVKRFKAFCRDAAGLDAFYGEVGKVGLGAPSPFTPAMPIADFDVPPMQLPPHLLHRVAMKGIL